MRPTRGLRPKLATRYRVLDVIGRGGMGVVYRVHDRHENRFVAVKTLAPPPGHELLAFLRFTREARTASSLHHPNICEIFEIATFGGEPYIVMELLSGETVRELLLRGPADTATTIAIVRQVAEGLRAVHTRDIIHRDVKPGNVFVTDRGVVKLLDFGLAKHFAAVDADTTSGSVTVTEPGQTPGTVNYMSPEQLRGGRLDQRTDLFSLGVMTYEMLTGRPPFTRTTAAETIAAILHGERPPLGDVPCRRQWGYVLDRLLANDVVRRYPDADSLLADLASVERASRGEPVARLRGRLAAGQEDELSLAIVPFVAVDDAVEDRIDLASFSHALHDGISAGLSQVKGLRVVARTLTSKAMKPGRPLARVAQQLRAARLLTGVLTREHDRFTIVLQLYDQTSSVLWTRKYHVSIEDVFRITDQIVQQVARAVGLLASPPRRRAAPPANREALQLCLKGSVFWSRRYEDGLKKAVQCFTAAIALEPTLALAHAGLADTYSFLAFYSLIKPRQAFELARTHAFHALALDPDLAPAHASLGLVKLGADWDWDGAAAEFRTAVRLDPTHALAHIYLSWTLVLQGQVNEAHEEAVRAQDCDPASPLLNAAAAYTFFLSRSYDRAIAECEKALEIDDGFLVAKYVMALCQGEQAWRCREEGLRGESRRLYDEAISTLEHVVERAGDMAFYLALLGKMYAERGTPSSVKKARAMMKRFDQLSATGVYVGPHAWVYVYAGLGEFDKALARQKKAFEDGAPPFNYLSPQLGRLHVQPGFLQELTRRNPRTSAAMLIRTRLAERLAADGRVQPV